MPRFVTDRDVSFMQNINKELIDTVIQTPVTLFKLYVENSPTNIYGEAPRKEYYVGVDLTCLIKRDDVSQVNEVKTVDAQQTATFAFLRISLQEVNTYPEVGDIILFDSLYYEIDNVVENKLVAGQPYFNYTISCNTHLTRKSNIQLEERQQ